MGLTRLNIRPMTESIGPHNLRSRSELRHCIMFLFIISRARFLFLEFGGLRQVCDRYSRKLVTFSTLVNDDLQLRGNPSGIFSRTRWKGAGITRIDKPHHGQLWSEHNFIWTAQEPPEF